MTTLRNVLMINAVTSGITGLILAIVPGFVANLFATSNTTAFVSVGIFLFAFAVMVFIASFQNPLREKTVNIIITLDTLWVITSLAIIVLQVLDVSIVGYFLIAGVAAWVGFMAYLQFKGRKQLLQNKLETHNN
jgi:hypothetical protein